jgi:hypothetical protein
MPGRLGGRVWFAWGRRNSDRVCCGLPTILVLSCCRPPLAWLKAEALTGDQAACLMPHMFTRGGTGQTRRCAYVIPCRIAEPAI